MRNDYSVGLGFTDVHVNLKGAAAELTLASNTVPHKVDLKTGEVQFKRGSAAAPGLSSLKPIKPQ
jgi:hypothetical protein